MQPKKWRTQQKKRETQPIRWTQQTIDMAKGMYFKTKRDQKGGEWLTKDATNMADKEFILDVLRSVW
jgi:hypothetical protein